MKLSVIIPVFNSDKYLNECLESVFKQSYKNMEVIIINDGSTDESEIIIKKYQKKYKDKIKYISIANHGQAYARNLGLKEAIGDIITFLDSDDYINPFMYEKMISTMEKEQTDLVICDILTEEEFTKNKKNINCTTFDNIFNSYCSMCNKIFKKEILENINFIEGIWYEDYNFYINVCLKNPKYSVCKEPLYIYRLREESTMHNNNSLKNLDIITATEDIINKNCSKKVADTLIINHILIDAINRLYYQKSKDKKIVIKKLNKYIKMNIPNIFKTDNYKSSSLNRKIIMILNYYNLGFISHILLSIRKKVKLL